ncbi:MAG: PrsW family intramembrane metalloprotease [Patescibacteria group bacterium]|nr:PrsW family intramembrane metalloprotease [Patescibacteria group bacterium]MDD5121606.1 PrsW family intramembrane metalloprotease [Patescibacteria group bacterium]MDD5222275.1 PrsW family intramembrane metalloprotease [Patescibacteria group bacterium]MDD5396230.1 PrsW family intramembrane metalloprotease [Patescibacteria group bacterium]
MNVQALKEFFLSLDPQNIVLFTLITALLCLAWIFLCLRLDRESPEPKEQIVRIFFWGGLMVFPALFIAGPITVFINKFTFLSSLAQILILSFLVDGLIEEFIKFSIISEKVYRKPFFDEPRDGLIYGMILGIGFSFLESFFYSLTLVGEQHAFLIILMRGLMTTFMHLLAGGIIGYHFGLAKFAHFYRHKLATKGYQRMLVWRGLILAICFHALYNLVIRFNYVWLMIPLAVLLIGVYISIILGLRKTQTLFKSNAL